MNNTIAQIISLGLPMPVLANGVAMWMDTEADGYELELVPGNQHRHNGILFEVTEDEKIAPVLTDFAILGWLLKEYEAREGKQYCGLARVESVLYWLTKR